MISAFTAAVAAILWLGLSLAAQSESFKARLSPTPSVPANRDNLTGIGSVTATLVGRKLSIAGKFEGLRTPATVARIHRSSVTGVRGPAVFDLVISKATSGELSGSFDLGPEQVDILNKGRFYIQIHSEKAPEGNLWGWLLR